MHMLKLITLDQAVGLALPKEVLSKLRRTAGDTVFLTETAEGWLLSAHDPAILDQIEAGREFVDHYREVLQALVE